MRIICHDNRSVLKGEIRNVKDDGCEFLAAPSGSATTPTFPKKTMIWLNFFDESSGQCLTVEGRLSGVSRRDGAWSYRIHWNKVPDILKSAA